LQFFQGRKRLSKLVVINQFKLSKNTINRINSGFFIM
jgi:hypothetical protein